MLSSGTVGAIVSGSCLSFWLLNAALRNAPPDEKIVAPTRRQKWRNEICSLVHAMVVAFGALHCWTMLPLGGSTQKDVTYLREVEIFGAISSGYYLYDFGDLTLHNSPTRVLGLCAHHVVGIGCFYVSYRLGRFYDLLTYCMMVHLSGIFLHVRMLMVMRGTERTCPFYVINALINVAAFATFRLGILAYTCVIVYCEPDLGVVARGVCLFLAVGLLALNLVLFKRLVISDIFLVRAKSTSKKHDDCVFDTNGAK